MSSPRAHTRALIVSLPPNSCLHPIVALTSLPCVMHLGRASIGVPPQLIFAMLSLWSANLRSHRIGSLHPVPTTLINRTRQIRPDLRPCTSVTGYLDGTPKPSSITPTFNSNRPRHRRRRLGRDSRLYPSRRSRGLGAILSPPRLGRLPMPTPTRGWRVAADRRRLCPGHRHGAVGRLRPTTTYGTARHADGSARRTAPNVGII